MEKIADPVQCELDLFPPNEIIPRLAVERLALLIMFRKCCPQAFEKRPPAEKQPSYMVALARVPAQVLGRDVMLLAIFFVSSRSSSTNDFLMDATMASFVKRSS